MQFNKLVLSMLIGASLMSATAAVQARELVLGLIPADNNEEMIKTFEPMRAYLEKKLGQK